jgi:signal transduction histidine kinase
VLLCVFAGLVWWRARPWSSVGPWLVALGMIGALTSLQGSANADAFSVGVFLDAPLVLLAWYLFFSFPSGRLDRTGRVFMAYATSVLVFGFAAKTLFTPHVGGTTPLARCADACPANTLLITDNADLASVFRDIELWGRIGVALALIWILTERLARASRPRLRLVVPVYVVALLWLSAFTLYSAAVNADASRALLDVLGAGVTLTRVGIPIGFLAAIVLARMHAGVALESMARELTATSTAESAERLVRRVLDDPSARLAFWVRRARAYVDASGQTVTLPPADTGQVSREFRRADGMPVVAVLHDPVLDEDPELLDGVGTATVLALENRRLDEGLRRSFDELRASRKRLVTAVAGERRRMERDLHDSAQQRLLALRIQLELVRATPAVDPTTREKLAALGDDLDTAIDELRTLAHGIYPPALAEGGLRDALPEAAARSGMSVEVDVPALPRYAEEVEEGVYFTCLEALQNASKHAGIGVRVRLVVRERDGELVFSVSDDGTGFEPSGPRPGGLTNISDRIGALGGTISIVSAPEQGTIVSGTVPLAG